MTEARSGMRIESQNVFSPAALDPTQLVDTVFRSGFDHHTFMVKPRIVNQAMQTFARTLTGYGTLPDDASVPEARATFEQPEVCVIGAGRAGRAAADRLQEEGLEVVVFDRHGVGGARRAGVFAAYPGEHIVCAGGTDPDKTQLLHAVRPRHIVFAMGRRDVVIPVPNNDLPGVVSAHGLGALLSATGRTLAGDVVVVGEDGLEQAAVQRLRAHANDHSSCTVTGVDVGDVARITGNSRVEGVVTKDGRIPCSLVAFASTRAPAYDLAAQAGCAISFDAGGFVVRRQGHEPVLRWGDRVTLWAAGSVVGALDSAADGTAVAEAILAVHADRRQEGVA